MFPGYTPEAKAEIVGHILDQVSCGRSVARITSEDDGMPNQATFWSWVRLDPELSEQLGRARERGIEALLDDVIDIVDDATDDAEIVYGKEGAAIGAKINGKAIRRASLMAEYRVKMAQMLKPKTYGPKVDITSGGDKLEPGQVNDNRLQAIVGLVAQRKAQAALPKPEEERPNDGFDPLS